MRSSRPSARAAPSPCPTPRRPRRSCGWTTIRPQLQPLLNDRVRWVQLPWAGVEQWMSAGVIDDERVWTCASEAYGDAVAEQVVALMLAGRRRIHAAARATSWDISNGGQPLFGATMVVVGTGSIGRGVTRLLGPWGMTFIGVSRSGRPADGFARVVPVGELRPCCRRPTSS